MGGGGYAGYQDRGSGATSIGGHRTGRTGILRNPGGHTWGSCELHSTTRSTLFPEIQTLTELGYPSNLSSVYFGLVAPSGTPKAIISKLRDEIVNIANEPGFRQKHLIERGLEPILNTPEEFGQLLKQDRASFERVVMDAGLQPQ